MNITADICLQAYSINTSWNFIATMSAVFLLDFISLGLMLWVFALLLSSKVLHLHLKIFLANLTFSLFIRNSLTLFRAGTILFKNCFLTSDPCIFAADSLTCRRSSEIDKAPIELIVYGIALVSLERFVATLYYKNYEKYNNVWVSFAAVFVTWIYPIVHLIFVFNDPEIESKLVPYCSSLTSNAIDFFTMISVKTPVCTFCTVINFITLWLAVRNKKNESSTGYEHISGRYQLNESIKFTRMIAVSNGICHFLVIFNVFTVILISKVSFTNYGTFATAKELSSLTFPIYGNIYCFIALAFYYQSKLTKNGFCFKKNRVFTQIQAAEEATAASENYFKFLRNQWS